MINVVSRIFCFHVLEIFILPFESESHVKNLHFANWKRLEISGPPPWPPPPPPPQKECRWVMILGLGPLHFERDFCGVTSTTSSPNLHPLDLMLWYQKNDAIHLFYTCLSSPKIWKSENQVGLIWLLVNCVVNLSNKDFLSNWWLWMSQKRFLF